MLVIKLNFWAFMFQVTFVISDPDVFKSPTSDTYIAVGEVKIQVLSSNAQTRAAEQIKAPVMSNVALKPESSNVAQDDEEMDEKGLDPLDIEVVMTQTGVTRAKAVNSLRAADGNIVFAILELTA